MKFWILRLEQKCSLLTETHNISCSSPWFVSISDICMIDKTICRNGTCLRGPSGHFCACHKGFTDYGNNGSHCTGKNKATLNFFQHPLLNQCLFSKYIIRTFSWYHHNFSAMVIRSTLNETKLPFLSVKLWCFQYEQWERGKATPETFLSQYNIHLKCLSPHTSVSFSPTFPSRNFMQHTILWCSWKTAVWSLQKVRIQQIWMEMTYFRYYCT